MKATKPNETSDVCIFVSQIKEKKFIGQRGLLWSFCKIFLLFFYFSNEFKGEEGGKRDRGRDRERHRERLRDRDRGEPKREIVAFIWKEAYH